MMLQIWIYPLNSSQALTRVCSELWHHKSTVFEISGIVGPPENAVCSTECLTTEPPLYNYYYSYLLWKADSLIETILLLKCNIDMSACALFIPINWFVDILFSISWKWFFFSPQIYNTSGFQLINQMPPLLFTSVLGW